MPRRAVFIVLIALFSLGLFSVRPALSEIAKAPASIAADKVAGLDLPVRESEILLT